MAAATPESFPAVTLPDVILLRVCASRSSLYMAKLHGHCDGEPTLSRGLLECVI
ncbi:hypothetical protein M8C21_028433 [Ambrosia artemisiifolia]|uniref:Uncharacterized protein n=1 Tax=Ambrosia artemisiifolia TaxID=4212 RepID=A0AAD5CZX3_AMBAR|nr:hypothetical protein M8C21_028433 [Ambrosia artemisiifolia]